MIRAIVWKTVQEGAPVVLMAFLLTIGPNFYISIGHHAEADVQLAVLLFIWHLFGVILAAGLLPQERDRGTLPFLLSQPLARANLLAYFILGGLLLHLTMFALTIPWCGAIINIVQPYTLTTALSDPLLLIGMLGSLLAFSITVFVSSALRPADSHGRGPLLVIGISVPIVAAQYVALNTIFENWYARGLPPLVLVGRVSGITISASLFLLLLSIVLEGAVGSATNRERAASLPYALVLLLSAGMLAVTTHPVMPKLGGGRLIDQAEFRIGWFTPSPTRPELVVSVGGNLLRVDTSGQVVQLFRGSIRNLSWSPTGNRLAFWSEHFGSRWVLWTMNRDGSQLNKITKTISMWSASFVWSPDGEDLVVLKDYSGRISPRIGPTKVLEMIGPEGTTSIDLSEPLQADGWLSGLGWLEGRRFLYTRQELRPRRPSTRSLWTIEPGDTKPTQVANSSPTYWIGVAPRGTRVWSAHWGPWVDDPEKQGIWLMDPDEWEWVKIEDGKVRPWLGRAWSHDGRRLIYSALRPETEDLVVYDIDKGEKTILHSLPREVAEEITRRRRSRRAVPKVRVRREFHRINAVKWSADDDRLLFLQSDEDWNINLIVFDLVDGQMKNVASNVERATWLTSAEVVYQKKDELWLADRNGSEPRKIYPAALNEKTEER